MKTASLLSNSRALIGLAVAGGALLAATGASAQTSTPFYAFVVNDLTAAPTFDPVYTVYDSVNFSAVQVNEVFADNFTQSFTFPTLGAQDLAPSSLQTLTSLPGGGYADPAHGVLTSATLTGTLSFPGIAPDGSGNLLVTVQPTADPNSQYQELVSTSFSASLFGAASTGVPIGTFSLMNLGSGQGTTVSIDAAPVPEASTTVSLGLLLALGVGSLVIARRKRSAIAAG